MANLISKATGNWLTAGTWALVDSTSYLNSETGNTALTTSYVESSSFTPGAIQIDGIAVKIASRSASPSGTISIRLAQAGSTVAGTEVTIDVADLPTASGTSVTQLEGGWVLFKFSASVTLSAATAYTVSGKTSSSSMVNLFRDSTAGNWSRMLRTTTTQAPVAGDDVCVIGEHTGSGTGNSFTVTMNETASTDYGSNTTSTVTPAIAIGKRGTLSYGTSAATNYLLKVSGHLIVYNQGTFNIGTSGTPIPRGSTAKLQFDCVSNVDFGLIVRNGATFTSQGLSRTSGKNIVSCLLNADAAANATTLNVDTDTGWLDNDAIAVASTTQTNTQCESGALNGNAGASSLTVDTFGGTGGGVANAHGGTSPVVAEVILLTRNVQIFGTSTSVQSFVTFFGTASVDIDWTEFYNLGSATIRKRGFDLQVDTGCDINIQYSSLHDFVVSSSQGFVVTTTTAPTIVVSNCVTYNIANNHFICSSGPVSGTVSNCIFMLSTAFTNIVDCSGTGWSWSNITCVGGASNGFKIATSITTENTDTYSNITTHSCGAVGFTAAGWGVTVSNLTSWRNLTYGMQFTGGNIFNFSLTTATMFGNVGGINFAVSAARLYFKGLTISGDSSFASSYGFLLNNNVPVTQVDIVDSDFGTVTGIKTAHTIADIEISSGPQHVDITLWNTKLSSTTEVDNNAAITTHSFIGSEKTDQTAGNHRAWKRFGTIAVDTTAGLFRTASPSERLTPNNASNKLISGTKQVAVQSGTAITPSVYVRESVVGDGTDYNGNRIRLILKANSAIGINSDTVLATATVSSEGAFEQLTATTATPTDDGVMEFYVDCDGTTGWINVDDWTVT